ncbi:hypothetical protein [Flavobacterium subsaxonicum]|uniref:hypothetical protein n=1 Tax=Flavobacterium subsaxonicum TaxID=426226 RepID=UPI00040820CF|nr:hypothetical protein [Flavobacterium subsaxonicum]
MKKIVLLAALSLLGSIAMSCDNESVSDTNNPDSYADGFSTDDGLIPIPPPPPPPVKPK